MTNKSIAVPAIKSVADAGRIFYGESVRGAEMGARMLTLWPELADAASIKSDDATRAKFNSGVREAFDSRKANHTFMVRLDDGTYEECDAGTDGATRVTTADFKGRDKKAWGEIKRNAPSRHKIESAYRERATGAVTSAWQNLCRVVKLAQEKTAAPRATKAFVIFGLDTLAKLSARATKAAEKAELSPEEVALFRPALANVIGLLHDFEKARKAAAPTPE